MNEFLLVLRCFDGGVLWIVLGLLCYVLGRVLCVMVYTWVLYSTRGLLCLGFWVLRSLVFAGLTMVSQQPSLN